MLSGGKGSSGADVGLATKTTTPFPTKDPPTAYSHVTYPDTDTPATEYPICCLCDV